MKKFLFIAVLMITTISCSQESEFSTKDRQGFSFDEGASPLCCSCNGTCCSIGTYQFGIVSPMASTWIVPNKSVNVTLTTTVFPTSETVYKSDVGGTITYKIINFGGSTFRYKDPFGNWITLAPGTFGVFSRQILPYGCSRNVRVEIFSTQIERTICDPATGYGQFNVRIELYSITNEGHTLVSPGQNGFSAQTQFGGQSCN
jgi:hypothetical protein